MSEIGVCGHPKPDGTTCERPVYDGAARCWQHLHPASRGRLRRKALIGEADDEIGDALKDPDLLDVRRPVAMGEAIVRRTPLLATEDMARRAAQRRIARDIGFGLVKGWRAEIVDLEEREGEDLVAAMLEALDAFLEPTEGDLDLETLAIHERSQKLVAAHAKSQVDAVKALEWAKVMREQLLPVLGELSLRFGTLLRKYVETAKVPAAIDELQTIIQRTIGEMSEVKEGQ